MDSRTIGLGLIWMGALLLAAVLAHRVRRGAWGADAFDATPALARWPLAVAILGVAVALVGVVAVVWSLL